MTAAKWPPDFDADRLVKMRVTLTDDESAGGESFWAAPEGDELYTVANLLTDAPFTLGDTVRAIEHPWGSRQVVEVVRRSPASQFLVGFAMDSCRSDDPAVADQGITAVRALMRAFSDLGAAVEGHVAGLFSVSAVFPDGDDPDDDMVFSRAVAGFTATALRDAAHSSPEATAAFDAVERRVTEGVEEKVEFSLLNHPSHALGTVDGAIDTTPETDPRLPAFGYDATADDAMADAITPVLAKYGPPLGLDAHMVAHGVNRLAETDQRVRDAIRSGNLAGPAEVALRMILVSGGVTNLPPPDGPLL